MRRRRRRWKRPHATAAARDSLLPDVGDGEAGSPPDTESDAPRSIKDSPPVKIEERFGVPEGAGHFFRIEAASGRSFAVWAGSEEVARAAAEWIDRVTIVTGRDTFRIAAVPVRLEEGTDVDREIAKVREIKN